MSRKKLPAGPMDAPKGGQSGALLASDLHRKLRGGVGKGWMVALLPCQWAIWCCRCQVRQLAGGPCWCGASPCWRPSP